MGFCTKLTVDGVEYDIRIKMDSIKRSFSIIEGKNKGMSISNKTIRDVVGTGYTYQLDIEPNPTNPTSYDALYEVLTAPVETHAVSLPYGQTTLSFDAQVISGTDNFHGAFAGANRWRGLSVQFKYIRPQREA